MEIKAIEKDYLDLMKKIESYSEAISLMFWDMRTGAPKKGIEQRSEVIGMLSSEVFKLSTSKEMGNFIQALTEPNT